MPDLPELKGIFLPLTTPFDSSGRFSVAHMRGNVEKYNRTRAAGYVATGSTGEAVLLSAAETEELWATVAEAASGGKILVAGTGAESTAETIALTRRAAGIGYGVALVRTPHYYRPLMTPDVLADFFLCVAEASPIPVVIYSIPQFTGITVEAPLVARLAEHPNIVGIKDSSGSVQRVAEIVNAVPASFRVLVGSASTLVSSLMVGASGGILGLADSLPEACVDLYQAVLAGRFEEARDLQRKLLPASQLLVSQTGVAGTKYVLDRLGYYGGPVREPLRGLSAEVRATIDRVLAGLGILAATGA
ncbi:MAG TPA: dihydrodipicolinate synthase family protein [Candidatus Dormibacteraeota bacterium]|nr:dihydrodipicolinate synthase family protein [Candidatus Dormibacteraeota bacterium]